MKDHIELKKVAKCKPKKIPENDDIFNYVHNISKLSDSTSGTKTVNGY